MCGIVGDAHDTAAIDGVLRAAQEGRTDIVGQRVAFGAGRQGGMAASSVTQSVAGLEVLLSTVLPGGAGVGVGAVASGVWGVLGVSVEMVGASGRRASVAEGGVSA